MPGHSKITISTLRTKKRDGKKISMLTCYDFATSRLCAEAGLDSLLVGDTYAEVCLGHPTTLPATMEHLVVIAEAVRRGAPDLFLVGDMPFLSYQVTPEEAIRNAGLYMAKAGCDCVKIEVDRRHLRTVEAMAAASIPVMAHLGLKPQWIQHMGGYRAQGTKAADAMKIIEDAQMMESAGAVALLLEAVPQELAAQIARSTELPVIGCVSGPLCDGQVVVLHDILGYQAGHPPRSVKQYLRLHDQLVGAFREYVHDVHAGAFPIPQNSLSMDRAEWEALSRAVESR
jgi:3-methyl-2-oxobutanoate hydroxymethyltransferase